MTKSLKPYFAIALASCLWGGTFVWSKEALKYFPPQTLILHRLIIAAVVLIPLGFALGRMQRITLRQLRDIALLAFVEPFLYFVGETNALTMVSSTVASVVVSTIPVFTPVFALVMLGEKIVWKSLLGIVLTIAGVLMVALQADMTFSTTPTGILLLMLAVFAANTYGILVSRMSSKINTYTIVAYQNLIGAIYFIPLTFGTEWIAMQEVEYSFRTLLPVVELSVFGSAIAFLLFTYSIQQLGVVKATVFTNLIPVITAITAYFLLHEPLSQLNVFGVFVVIAGVFVVQYIYRRKQITDSAKQKKQT